MAYIVIAPSQFADLYAQIPEVEVMPLRGELGVIDGCVRIVDSVARIPTDRQPVPPTFKGKRIAQWKTERGLR